MASISTIALALIVITCSAFAVFLFYSFQIHRAKPAELAWRGIVKLVSLGGVPASIAGLYPKWFAALCAFFLSGCVTAGVLVWSSDHSFLVVIFPLLFYYFFARYFLWEKADIAD